MIGYPSFLVEKYPHGQIDLPGGGALFSHPWRNLILIMYGMMMHARNFLFDMEDLYTKLLFFQIYT